MDKSDIVIIGTGPAGLSAALTARNRNKKITLIGPSDLSIKVQKAHEINNYLGFPHAKGSELANAFLNHLKEAQIDILDARVTKVFNLGDNFAVQVNQDMLMTDSVIIASGMIMNKPYRGEEEYLGCGVSYCATCDAALYKGKTAIMISFDKQYEEEAIFLTEYADNVTYIPIYKDCSFAGNDKIEIVNERPEEIVKSDNKIQLKTDKSILNADGVFILRDAIAPNKLVDGLELDGQHIAVNRNMETNIPGIFACGDITGTPYQYMKSAGEGTVAAISVASYLDKMK